MKRLIALLCLLAVVLPLCACTAKLEPVESTPEVEAKTEEKKEPTNQNTNISSDEEEEEEIDPIVYPEGFSVGYSREDISMTPLPIYEGTAESVHDPIMLTCTAVCDGENVALLMSADLKGMNRNLIDQSRELINKLFGVPVENIIINTTHTHSAHTAGGSSADQTRWAKLWFEQLKFVAEDSLRDLAPAEAYIGKSHTDGITFVRRYRLADGTYKTNPSSADSPVAHESVADNELRTIRFVREEKRDVLMVNYQTHYGGATSMYPDQLSADFITPFRDRAEEEMHCYFVYHSGASGNLNFKSAIAGERKYADFILAIDGFMEATNNALKKETKVNTGKIVAFEDVYTATVLHDSDERVQQAKQIVDAPEGQKSALCKKYGFESKREASAVVTRAGYGETQDIALCAIAFGDIAFTAFPYEMFDQNGKECRAASPYKMTFICSLANGGYGYIPTYSAFPHGGYEVYVTRFARGTGEALVNKMVELLKQCKTAA